MNTLLYAITICMTTAYGLAAAVSFFSGTRWSRWAGNAGFALNMLSFFLIAYTARRLPIFGSFESITTLTLVLACLHVVNLYASRGNRRRFHSYHARWVYSAIFLLLIYLSFYPKVLNQDFYMYDDFRVILFFHLRMLSSGIFIYAGLIYGASLRCRLGDRLHAGRNFLLTGAVVFLTSEFFGSLWCLAWFGDSWHWSGGFLKASGLFLTAMLACHPPPRWQLSDRFHAVMGGVPAVWSLWLLFLH